MTTAVLLYVGGILFIVLVLNYARGHESEMLRLFVRGRAAGTPANCGHESEINRPASSPACCDAKAVDRELALHR
jgi:hypothetical protein